MVKNRLQVWREQAADLAAAEISLREWRRSAQQPTTAKTRKTSPRPRATRRPDKNPPDRWPLATWFTALRTRREHPWPRDKALTFIDKQLRTGKFGTKPELPLGWRLKLVGADDTLYVVWSGRRLDARKTLFAGRLDAREVLVFEKILAPVPLTPALLEALSRPGKDTARSVSSREETVPSPQPELVDKKDWLVTTLEAHPQRPKELMSIYAQRIFNLAQEAPLAKPWEKVETVRRLIYALRKGVAS
jgi:hypothetical protein